MRSRDGLETLARMVSYKYSSCGLFEVPFLFSEPTQKRLLLLFLVRVPSFIA